MTKEEFRRVEAWLYSIRYLPLAIEDLKKALELLETRASSPPSWTSHMTLVPVVGGEQDSRQARWVEFLDDYETRRRELLRQISIRENKLSSYKRVMELLEAQNSQYTQLVRAKYINIVRPDSAIYEGILFVSKNLFYEMRLYVVKAFSYALPGQFDDYSGRKEGEKRDQKPQKP